MCGTCQEETQDTPCLDKFLVKSSDSVEEMYEYECGTCQRALLNPHQTQCGLRVCGTCIDDRIHEKGDPAPCWCETSDCIGKISKTNRDYMVYPDYSLLRELKKKAVPCRYKYNGCSVAAMETELMNHEDNCEYGKVDCEFSSLGCPEKVKLTERESHSMECDFIPRNCPYCSLPNIASVNVEAHIKNDCGEIQMGCPNNCNTTKIARKDLQKHLSVCLLQPLKCSFQVFGCRYKGTQEELQSHCGIQNNHVALIKVYMEDQLNQHKENEGQRSEHMKMMEDKVKYLEKSLVRSTENLKNTQKAVANKDQVLLDLQETVRELQHAQSRHRTSSDGTSMQNVQLLRSEVSSLEQTKSVVQTELTAMREQLTSVSMRFQEVDLRFQVLETASYDGTLVWKIRDYRSRKEDARQGRILSLYSQAFYTSRHGFRMCARVYLNGDGMGTGSHLSLFFVVMRGEYDALLPWPFRPKVSLMLLDQVGKTRHIVDTFRPDPSSTSFQKPVKEMNIASGCPLFVSHAILEANDSLFLRDDTLFIKVVVETTGLPSA